MIYLVGKVGGIGRGDVRSASDVIEVLREMGNEVCILGPDAKCTQGNADTEKVAQPEPQVPYTTVVNGALGMRIYDKHYKNLTPDVLIVRESPAHMQMRRRDPRKLIPAMERFRKMIFVSSIARDKWQRIGLRRDNTFYIPNTIRDPTEEISKINLESAESSKLVVLIVGSFQPRKAQDVVVRAVLKNTLLQDNYRFVFLGGLNNRYARKLVKMSRRCDSLVFLGKRDATPYVRAADIMLQPSRAEAMSRAMLKSLKYGKPLICTKIEGNAEAVEHMVDGILIPVNSQEGMVNALEYLRNHPSKRKAMARAAQIKFETEYSWKNYKERWGNFMRENIVIAPGGRN